MNLDNLTNCLFQYFPKGLAWQPAVNPELNNLLKIVAEEVIRISQGFTTVEQSVDPRYAASELIKDWANLLAIPDKSTDSRENRNFLHDKLTNTRGQSEEDILYLPSLTSPNLRIHSIQIAKVGQMKIGQPLYQDEYNFTYIFDRLSLHDYGEGPELDRKAIDIIEKTKQAHCAALYYHNFYNRYQNVSD